MVCGNGKNIAKTDLENKPELGSKMRKKSRNKISKQSVWKRLHIKVSFDGESKRKERS